ncbi:MAG: C40 family peptidase [Streptosporangiaceae bacterium]
MSYGSRSRGGSRSSAGGLAAAVAAALLAAYVTGHSGTSGGGADASLAGGQSAAAVVTEAVAYARQQLGKPYVWGGPTLAGTGYGFDCSGLVMEAYQAGGLRIKRTSQQQWASEPHIAASQVKAGDLVFFTGVLEPGEKPPGHVGLVVNPAKHLMIDAYAAGFPVRYDTYGLPGSAEGLGDPLGFTDPAAAIRGP